MLKSQIIFFLKNRITYFQWSFFLKILWQGIFMFIGNIQILYRGEFLERYFLFKNKPIMKCEIIILTPVSCCNLAMPILHLIPNEIINPMEKNKASFSYIRISTWPGSQGEIFQLPRQVRTATVYLLDKQGHSGLIYLSIGRNGGLSGNGIESSESSLPNWAAGAPSRSAYRLKKTIKRFLIYKNWRFRENSTQYLRKIAFFFISRFKVLVLTPATRIIKIHISSIPPSSCRSKLN